MTEEEKAIARAQGALDNFIEAMHVEMNWKERSQEYRDAFYIALQKAMEAKDLQWFLS